MMAQGQQRFMFWFTEWPATHERAGQTVEVVPRSEYARLERERDDARAEVERLRKELAEAQDAWEQDNREKHEWMEHYRKFAAENERLRDAQRKWAQDLLAVQERANSEVSARVDALVAPLRETLRIARFDAEVPVRELREENERLRLALREAISWSYGEDATPERRDEIERLCDDSS